MPKSKANTRPYNKNEKAGKASGKLSQQDRSMYNKMDTAKNEARKMTEKVAGKAMGKRMNAIAKPGTVKASPRRAMPSRGK